MLITGSSGLIGTALVGHLRSRGHEVTRLVRATPGPGERRWDPGSGELAPGVFDGIDAVVHLAGTGIGDRRWTPAYKQEILESRTRTTDLLARTISSLDRRPAVWLSGSAVGIYGARGDEELTEASEPGTGFLADVCRQWEAATAPAAAAGVRVAHLRTGVVLSADGGALRKQLPLFKLGVGGKMGAGTAWQSWISITDEVRAIEHLLAHPAAAEVSGPVNLTAPAPVTNAQFAKELGRVLRRPAVLPVPGFAPKLLLGGELVDNLLLSGQRVLPRVLQQHGFEFEHPSLELALRVLLDRPAA